MKTEQLGDLAIDDAPGALYVLRSTSNCDRAFDFYGTAEIFHVISRPAKCEVRGYYRELGTSDAVRIRLPNYVGEWPEVDAAFEALTGIKVAA